MSHCVVVWEWQNGEEWLPHSAGVSRTLERAYEKRLTRVVLADAEPALRGHYVNLRSLTQTSDESEAGGTRVRRALYASDAPCAKGVNWGWSGFGRSVPFSIAVQCLLESSWRAGIDEVRAPPWAVSLVRMTARWADGTAAVRRRTGAPYPRARPDLPPPLPPQRPREAPSRIPQQLTGSSIHSNNSAISTQSAPPRVTQTRPESPRDRKPNLARQILHNLNIFGNRSSLDDSSGRDGMEWRRHSVDTVSTYLSHESKDSDLPASTSPLDCSVGSDDVFETKEWGNNGGGNVGEGRGCASCGGWGQRRQEPQPPPEPQYELESGSQPPGSMTWARQPGGILVTFNFQSGIQGPTHPKPGAPYYAVGFPRHSLLPDNPVGHQMLTLLRACWSRGVVFRVAASRTTGREHVVAWRVPPPTTALAPTAAALLSLLSPNDAAKLPLPDLRRL